MNLKRENYNFYRLWEEENECDESVLINIILHRIGRWWNNKKEWKNYLYIKIKTDKSCYK